MPGCYVASRKAYLNHYVRHNALAFTLSDLREEERLAKANRRSKTSFTAEQARNDHQEPHRETITLLYAIALRAVGARCCLPSHFCPTIYPRPCSPLPVPDKFCPRTKLSGDKM